MTPLERAARALFRHEPGPYGDCVDWAIEQDFGWRDRVDEARIVLTAIREPSDAMWDAGVSVVSDPHYWSNEDRDKCEGVATWHAMIDAMLEAG